MRDIQSEFQERLEGAISRTDYTLDQLAEMDHPYAQRNNRTPAGMKPYMIHTRSGRMIRAFTFDRKGTNQYQEQLSVTFLPNAPYQAAVFYGSKKLRARNPIQGVLDEMNRENRFYEIYQKYAKRGVT